MTGKTHLTCGITFGLLISKYFNLDLVDSIPILLTSSIGSLVPDCDQKQSTIGKLLLIDNVIVKVNKIVSKMKIKALKGMAGHRGFTHCLIFPAILAFLYLNLGQLNWMLGLLVGYLSHLAIDMLNDKGIPVLFPLTTKKIHVLSITTGKWVESILWIGLWLVNIYLILKLAGVQISIK